MANELYRTLGIRNSTRAAKPTSNHRSSEHISTAVFKTLLNKGHQQTIDRLNNRSTKRRP